MTKEIKAYFGIYIGLSPTDESKIAMGEIEVVISEHGLKIRHATGLAIREEAVPLDQVRKLTEAEVTLQFNPGSDAPAIVDGFQIGEGATLLFWRETSVV